MTTNNQRPDVFFMLGELHDNFLAQEVEKIQEARDLLNKKRFRVADTPLSYRQVNSLDANGILKDDRKDKKLWREFSLKELVYLSIIKELRTFGIIDEQLEKLKKSFFSKEYTFSSDECLLDILRGVKIVLVLGNDSSVAFYTTPSLNLFERDSKLLININLNEIVLEIWEKMSKKRVEYKNELDLLGGIIDDFELDDKEARLIGLIRNKDFKTIIIKKNNQKEFIVKGERIEFISGKELVSMIKEKDFVDISIIKRDGQVVHTKIEETFKI